MILPFVDSPRLILPLMFLCWWIMMRFKWLLFLQLGQWSTFGTLEVAAHIEPETKEYSVVTEEDCEILKIPANNYAKLKTVCVSCCWWWWCSVIKSCSTLWLHGLQHTGLPCPSPSLRVCSNSYQQSQWCHATLSSSIAPSPPAFSLSQHQGLFQWVDSSRQVAKVLERQLENQSFQWIFRVDFL